MDKKSVILLTLFILMALGCHAQYNRGNSIERKALVVYKCGTDGYYYPQNNVALSEVNSVETSYAYDKKTHVLYVMTPNSNCAVTLTKEYAKKFNKKNVPILKTDQLQTAIAQHNASLEQKYSLINQQRTKHLEDSVAQAKAKAITDSLAKVSHDLLERAREIETREQYRNSHDWHKVPIDSRQMICEICKDTLTLQDSIYCMGVKNDSILYYTKKTGDLGKSYYVSHISSFPRELLAYPAYNYHYEVFKDSLTQYDVSRQWAERLNTYSLLDYIEKLRKEAPYGFLGEWGWDVKHKMVTFHFDYTNTSENTIKNVTVHFQLTDDAGDVKCSGYFQGTGPMELFDTCSWEWNDSPYTVSGNVSTMKLTKIVITFDNGDKTVLTKNQIVENG